MPESCFPARRLLAQGSMCAVEQCACGILHVSLGPFTMRLQADVVESVWRTLGEAIEKISGGARANAPSDAKNIAVS